MKMTIRFLAVVALSLGASSSVLAQYSQPGAAFSVPAPYYAADVGDLEARISKLEDGLKKKEDKVDTKKKFTAEVSGRVFLDAVTFGDPHTDWGIGEC